ncbi:hypothetical protein GCM10023080_059920 [Streptomyces pseudoechinosporeus]
MDPELRLQPALEGHGRDRLIHEHLCVGRDASGPAAGGVTFFCGTGVVVGLMAEGSWDENPMYGARAG